MLVFAYEFMNGGFFADHPGAESLSCEGWAMLSAVLADLQRCPGVETVTLLDPRRQAPGRVVHARGANAEEAGFRRLAREADGTLVIAPETDGILEARCRWVEEEGGKLLGPSVAAVRQTTDKFELAGILEGKRVPTPFTCLVDSEEPFPFPFVVKPRDGAGSVATVRIDTPDAWRGRRALTADDDWHGEEIVQPFVPGEAASVAVLAGPRDVVALVPAEQHLSDDGRFRYRGGALPLPSAEARRAQTLAERAVQAVPGLKGFVGVDLILGADGGGRLDSVIEINPRLTTSYVGLRQRARFNLAEAMLAAALGTALPDLTWNRSPVRWLADGTILADA